jgi:excisionase family DNA binding protein
MSRSQQQVQREVSDVPLQALLSIPDVARLLKLSRPKVYNLIHQEGLPVMHFGRASRVSPISLQRWLEQREQIG